jgi:hypothetical protein
MAGNGTNGDKPDSNEQSLDETEATTATEEAEASAGSTEEAEVDAATEDAAEASAPEAEDADEADEADADETVALVAKADAAEASESSEAPTSDDEDDDDALHSVGMFIEGDADAVDIDQIELPPELAEPSFSQVSRNKISWVIFIACIGVGAGLGNHINKKEELRIQVEYLFTGGLERHKRADIIERREQYAKEDTYAQNRYGEFRMIYTPQDALVTVTLIKYRESIADFMKRYVRGSSGRDCETQADCDEGHTCDLTQHICDSRQEVSRSNEICIQGCEGGQRMELQKFRELTEEAGVRTGEDGRQVTVVVAEQHIKDLPVTSRTNPLDAEHPDRPKACTDSTEDYCTFVYLVTITKDKYRPRKFVIFSEYSLEPPNLDLASGAETAQNGQRDVWQQLIFKNTGPSVFEVIWPGADLQPTPELFQEQYVRVMTSKIKCGLQPENYEVMEIKDFEALMALPEPDRFQKLSDHGLLGFGEGPTGKRWTLSEWEALVAEQRLDTPQASNIHLWIEANAAIESCECNPDLPPCWQSIGAEAPAAP